MRKKDKKIKTEKKPLMKLIEDVGIKWRKATKNTQKERTKGNKIVVERTMITEFKLDEPGHCDNVSSGEKRPPVKAGKDMCSVGMIRKGRNWGDYGGVFCGECPYFIPVKKKRECREIPR